MADFQVTAEELDRMILAWGGDTRIGSAVRELKALREQCERQRKALEDIETHRLNGKPTLAANIATKCLHPSADSEQP